MAKTQLENYIFKPGLGLNDNLFPNAYSLISQNKSFIQQETIVWIQAQIDAGIPGFVGYTYPQDKCIRDIGYIVDSYLFDLRYGGNAKTVESVGYYWDQDVAQVDGDRIPEVQAHTFIRNLILNNILLNVAYSATNVVAPQVIDTDLTAESGASARITELSSITINVIENGLSEMPELDPSGLGQVKIQGRYKLEDILVITNVTKNEIIYNFSNTLAGGEVSIQTRNSSTDFTSYLQTTDAITTLSLVYNTETHSATDSLQIFVEKTENGRSVTTVRPFDFGTDAIERMRVATPLSMLDADFEYGLQPTKWSAIGILRGYPSVYEIQGTEKNVLSVVTDASAGTDGIGQSLITVTTAGAHGIEPGSPITIKALEDSVIGASRAEGSFVVVEAPTSNTFTYFAKSKVGTTAGDVLSTTYTQLREAGFYTGSSIGKPEFTVLSNGSEGTLVVELDVPEASTIIPYDGPSPEIGAPLVNENLPTGTQVSGVITGSSGGGTFITPETVGDYVAGTTTISVADATGIVENLAFDRGDGQMVYISSITGNDLDFNTPITTPIIGNTTVYNNVTGLNSPSLGVNASFDVQRASGNYTVQVATAGEQYKSGDRIVIPGSELGGLNETHDLTIIVDTVTANGGIDTITFEGDAFDGTGTVSVSVPATGGNGEGARFDILYEDNSYGPVTVAQQDDSTNYSVKDQLVIRGDNFVNGLTPDNDLIITVEAIESAGAITTISVSGTAPDAFESYDDPSSSTSGSGTNLSFRVSRTGTVYSANIFNSINFLPGDTITVTGDNLGGTTPANDATITVNSVDGTGSITDFSVAGTAANVGSIDNQQADNLIGTGVLFDVALSAGNYSVTIGTAGTDYGVGQTFDISGVNLIGETPANDLQIEITNINASGGVTSVTSSGTAAGDSGSYVDVDGSNDSPEGDGAAFDVTRTGGEYIVETAIGGTQYKVGDRITLSGDELGGDSPKNDIVVNVVEVDAGGVILEDSSAGIAIEYQEAVEGTPFPLISTVTITESTTATITKGTEINFDALATLEVTFNNAHGLVPGDTFITTITSDDGVNNHNLAAGSFFASQIPDVDGLTFQARAPGTIDTTEIIQGTIYPRPDSFFIHRPFDGGVQLGTGGPQHGAQAIRQSKKYIRYQSGKGIMYTTGALFAPSYDLRSVTAEDVEVNSLITVTTDDNDHGVQEGGIIRLLGIETPGYNSGPETATPPEFDYEVIEVVDERSFKIRAQRRLGSTDAVLGFGSQMSVVSWHGATVRSGIFDDQNGIFWEYDGTQISVVQRTGTRQLAGTVNLTIDSNLVIGNNTRFRDQLKAGDRIIIRGMTHVVSHVNSQSECTITPDWRGVVDIAGAKANLVVDKKVKQNDFNLDRLDGTGPSGYDLDPAKMQMIGIQYSWYGAGFIDFMLRGADGNFVFAHRMRNSNVNTEAFMRSGNLPVRYEVSNEGPPGKLVEDIDDSQSTITLVDASFFPTRGTIYIDNEIINFTGRNGNTLTGCQRGATFTNFQAGAERSYTAGAATAHFARTGVILISNAITPLISHWGSAFITDGQFDDDRGYIFSYTESDVTVSTTLQTAFLIRLAPSVSNAIIGDLGERELLNRAQLLLQGIEVTSDGEDGAGNKIQGGIVIEGVLNPQNYPVNPDNIGWTGLAGVAQGGQPSFAQVASGGSVTWSTGEDATTSTATALTAITTTAQMNTFQFNGRRNYAYFYPSFNEENISVGDAVSDNKFPSGTTVTQITDYGSYVFVRFSNTSNTGLRDNETVEFQKGGDLVNRSFAFFDKASFESSGASNGTSATSGGSVTFPANTQIDNIELQTFGNTEFYRVEFNNSFNGTLTAGSGTIEFTFIQPPFAQPGETVFSFIAVPGERSVLNLDKLKELTNTTLGGRGTFPNGPDVLAINIFKVSGEDVNANIILTWGEAQA